MSRSGPKFVETLKDKGREGGRLVSSRSKSREVKESDRLGLSRKCLTESTVGDREVYRERETCGQEVCTMVEDQSCGSLPPEVSHHPW